MINSKEKADIADKILTLGKFSNIIIKLSDKDGAAYDVAIILQGMIKETLQWLENMPVYQSKVGIRRRTKAEIERAREAGEEADDEEESEDDDESDPGLSAMQIAARSFVNGVTYGEAHGLTRRGRKPGSKNKPKEF